MVCAERIDRSLWMRDARQDERDVNRAASAAGGSRGVADESLVYGIVHDLRTPMAAILASLEQMEMMERAGAGGVGGGGESLERSIERVRSSAARMADTIESLLGLAQAREGGERATERIDAASLAREVAEELGALAARAGVTLECAVSGDAWVWGEAAGIRRCLENVISNAVKFTGLVQGERRVWVRVGHTGRSAGSAGMVFVEVTDTGPGIPPEKLELVFTPFARIGGAGGRGRGSGLGLAIVREHMLAMGGRVRVESDGRRGTRVTMEFRATGLGSGGE